jgi:hypothetical protein
MSCFYVRVIYPSVARNRCLPDIISFRLADLFIYRKFESAFSLSLFFLFPESLRDVTFKYLQICEGLYGEGS